MQILGVYVRYETVMLALIVAGRLISGVFCQSCQVYSVYMVIMLLSPIRAYCRLSSRRTTQAALSGASSWVASSL